MTDITYNPASGVVTLPASNLYIRVSDGALHILSDRYGLMTPEPEAEAETAALAQIDGLATAVGALSGE